MLTEPMSPNASTSFMCLEMTYRETVNEYQWTWLAYTHLDAGRNETRKLPLLEVGDGALFGSRLALARCSRFLERVSSRGLGTRVTEISWGRICGDRVFRLQMNVRKKAG